MGIEVTEKFKNRWQIRKITPTILRFHKSGHRKFKSRSRSTWRRTWIFIQEGKGTSSLTGNYVCENILLYHPWRARFSYKSIKILENDVPKSTNTGNELSNVLLSLKADETEVSDFVNLLKDCKHGNEI